MLTVKSMKSGNRILIMIKNEKQEIDTRSFIRD